MRVLEGRVEGGEEGSVSAGKVTPPKTFTVLTKRGCFDMLTSMQRRQRKPTAAIVRNLCTYIWVMLFCL